jgi:hypothetical protein
MMRLSRRAGLRLMLGVAPAALLASAQGAAPGGGSSSIALAPIWVWKNYAGHGELKITDTATGGEIQSASGGTLPAFPITIDPTPYVSGAAGSKSGWTAQFRNSTKGTWTRLGSGDFEFTPGVEAGEDNAEYRISDDGGGTWSDWQAIQSLVLDRNRAPPPYFLVEDYGGSDLDRFNAARDAAEAAGGGTVTTLNRSTVHRFVEHSYTARVHYLFPNIKKPDAIHSETGSGCTPAGNGQATGWTPGFNHVIFSGVAAARAIQASGERVSVVGGTLDGNAFKMALHSTAGDNAEPTVSYGTCYAAPGVPRVGANMFNLQQQHLVRCAGPKAAGVANQARYGFYGMIGRDNVADGIHFYGSTDVEVSDCWFQDVFRGAINIVRSNATLVSWRNSVLTHPSKLIGSGIDHELSHNWAGDRYVFIVSSDDFYDNDFDAVVRYGNQYFFRGCTIGPGLALFVRNGDGCLVAFEGSQAHPRGTIRYHNRGGTTGTAGRFPRNAITGWSGATPHNCTFRFQDQDFLAWGDPYVYHAEPRRPADGQTWEIQMGETVDTGSRFRIELINCTARLASNFPAGGTSTVRLLRTAKSLTTTQVVHIDGLTIGAGFAQAAVQLAGQRLEYRNVVHKGFPGAAIEQICPGAGQYVAL